MARRARRSRWHPARAAGAPAPVNADAIAWTLADELPPASDDDPLVDALLEAQSYRLLAQQAIHALHDLTRERDRLREQHQLLLSEYRHLRESILRTEAA